MLEKIRRLPTWVILFGLVVFAVLVTVAVVQLYTRGVLPIAGPFVVAAWAPLLVWLRVAGIRMRTQRRQRVLTEKLGHLSRLVGAERNLPPGDRASAATDRSLAEAGPLVRAAQDLLAANRADSVTMVGRLAEVSVRWRPGAPLTQTVQETVVAAQRLTVAWGEVKDVRAGA